MTNKEIRGRAWELCREKFGLILSATFLLSLISSLTMSITAYVQIPLLTLAATVFLGVITAIVTLGMVRFILDLWHGETPALSTLFSQKHRFWTFVCYFILMSLIITGVMLAVMVPLTILGSVAMASSALYQIFMIVALPLMLVPVMWFTLRFELALTCMVIRHSYRTTECMRIAWRASKGKIWRLFCQMLVLNLPLFLAQGLLFGYQTYLSLTGQMLNAVGTILLDLGSILITALLSGYIYLGTYALHEQLLEEYFAAHPEQSAQELWNAPTEDPLLLEDEYEDIPEDEEKNEE